MKRSLARLVRVVFAGAAFCAAACGQNPESTERARGILTGPNLVLALSILFIVIAGGFLVGAVGLDRFVRSRNQLAVAPPEAEEEEEEQDEVVAGIGVGRAGVPRWLYAFYVLIPVFAFLYVVNNVALRPAAEEAPETAAPTGPQAEVTIVASAISFDLDQMQFPAGEEITVTLDNQDAGVPHDWVLWESEQAATANDEGAIIAQTNQITGSAEDEATFAAPEPGEYYFNCRVHPPSMNGTAEVVEG
jgi:plastocyanin